MGVGLPLHAAVFYCLQSFYGGLVEPLILLPFLFLCHEAAEADGKWADTMVTGVVGVILYD